jgi:hypothetical protein
MSKASRLKGHCNRLCTIFELPVHQRDISTGWLLLMFFRMGATMRVNVPVRSGISLTILLLTASSVHAAPNASNIPFIVTGVAHCGSTTDWGSYLNGALGGSSLTLLLIMLIKMPETVKQIFKKKRAVNE